MYRISGKTEDGKHVVSGCFDMYSSKGTPLPIMFSMMSVNNMVPSPIDFYHNAIKGGWSKKTIFNRLEEAYCDAYGKEFWEQVKKRLTKYINHA